MNRFWEKQDAERIIENAQDKGADFWRREREKRSLALFHDAARRVPAYKDFLKKHGVSAARIRTWRDFQKVPPTSKKDYLLRYPLEKLSWDGTLKKPLVFTSTSGSTGEPFYFPREERLDWQSSVIHEMFLRQDPAERGATLVIVCFGMGVWIGGLITYQAFMMASRRAGYPISIITPGINKAEIFKALKKLAPHYDRTILVGYPPFIKDVIDEAPAQGIDPQKLNLRLIFAAEVFSEGFRDYIAKRAGIKNIYLDNMHIYGSADLGTMAWESGVGVLVKKMAARDKKFFAGLFGAGEKMPTIAQYLPSFADFEAPDGEILITGDNAIPLIRYAIGDRGGVMDFDEMAERARTAGYDIMKEAKRVGLTRVSRLPFVYIFERSDFATTLYGLQIYPEIVRGALERGPLAKLFTGKFTMSTNFDKKQDQYLEINLEMRRGVMIDKRRGAEIAEEIAGQMRRKSAEFNELSKYLGKRALPRPIFWPFEDPKYFKPGIKQRWTKN